MSRRIKTVPAYHASMADLPQTPEVWRVITALVDHLTARPEQARPMADTQARAVRSRSTATEPALCLYYAIDDTTIYLLHVEEYDELLDD